MYGSSINKDNEKLIEVRNESQYSIGVITSTSNQFMKRALNEDLNDEQVRIEDEKELNNSSQFYPSPDNLNSSKNIFLIKL